MGLEKNLLSSLLLIFKKNALKGVFFFSIVFVIFYIAFSNKENGNVTASKKKQAVDKDVGTIVLNVFEAGTTNPIDDVKYILYKKNNDNTTSMIGNFTTASGKIEASNLKYGVYYFKADRAPEVFVGDEIEYPFTVNEYMPYVEKTIVKHKKDKEILSEINSIEFEKNEANKEFLYHLYKKNDNETNILIGIYEFSDDFVSISNLESNKYFFIVENKETGLFLNIKPLEFELNNNKIQIPKLKRANFREGINNDTVFNVVDSTIPTLTLNGTQYSLFNIDEENNEIYVTNYAAQYGQIVVSNLNPGKYYIIENAENSHYGLEKPKVNFTIPGQNSMVPESKNNFILNYIIKMTPIEDGENVVEDPVVDDQVGEMKEGDNKVVRNIKLVAQDITNKGVLLPEASFLLHRDDNSLIGKYTTTKEGSITLKNIPTGSYYLTEIKSPPGYTQVDVDKITFNIDETTPANIKVIANYTSAKEQINSAKIRQGITLGKTSQNVWGNAFILPDLTSTFHLHILVEFGNQLSKEKKLEVTKSFPSSFIINEEEIQIVNNEGVNVKETGSLTLEQQKLNFILEGKNETLVNQTYLFTIPFNFSSYITEEDILREVSQYNLSDQYVFLTGGQGLIAFSNDRIFIRSPLANPEIHTELNFKREYNNNWGNHLILERLWQKYYLCVEISFGNKTQNFKNVKIEKLIPVYTEIMFDEIEVTDEEGRDVFNNLAIDFNAETLSVNFLEHEKSFAYLSEKVYKLIIPLQFRTQAIDENLQNDYVTNERDTSKIGIPNQIKLAINDEKEEYYSETTTVKPPHINIVPSFKAIVPIPRVGSSECAFINRVLSYLFPS